MHDTVRGVAKRVRKSGFYQFRGRSNGAMFVILFLGKVCIQQFLS